MKIQRALRLTALLGVLAVSGVLSVPRASADPDNCFVWCDNGITVQGLETSFQSCQAVFAANCNQQGTYGGTFCFTGSPCQTY
jgi:hypothetical protein